MPPNQIAERIRTMRIMIGSMAFGIFAFGVIAVVVVVTGVMKTDESMATLFLILLGAIAAVEVVAYAMIRQATITKTRQALEGRAAAESRENVLLGSYAPLTIIAGAMLEGLGLFAAVIVLLTGWVVVVIASGVAIVLLLALVFPTKSKAEGFFSSVTGEQCVLEDTI